MKKQKKLPLGFLSLCLLTILFFAMPVQAQAATFKRCGREIKTGKYYIWTDYNSNAVRISTSKSGNGAVLVRAASGRSITHACISDGSTVYYVEHGAYDVNGNYTGYVCKIKTSGKSQAILGKLKNVSCPTAYYGGNLYLDCYDPSDGTLIHTFRMNVKTGKTKRVMKNASVKEQSGQYLIAMPNSGAIVPRNLTVFNCKKGKATRITSKAGSAHFVGKKIYYAEYKKFTGGSDTLCIKSCTLSGKSKKTIVKEIKASSVGKITAKYVYYMTYTTRANYYRYDIKKKKAVKISQSQYMS